MKIAMFGTTLYAGVISSLLAESGHQVFICNDLQDHTALFNLRDQDVVRALEKQYQSGFLSYCNFAALPLDIDAYFFSFNPTQEAEALDVVQKLKMRTIIHPKLMINASTFGLNGTEKLKAVLTKDHWVYFPDIIQEVGDPDSRVTIKIKTEREDARRCFGAAAAFGGLNPQRAPAT